MKKAIIIIVCVLVVAVGALAGLYFFTPVFNYLKPANDNFAMQAKKLIGADEEGDYSEYEKFLNRLKAASGSQTANLDISMNVDLPTNSVDSATQKMINSSKINISSSYDADKKATSVSAGIKYNNEDLLTLDTLMKDQSISIRSNDIYDKYLTIDMSKYEEFCRKNNIEVDKETLESLELLKKLNEVDSSNLLYDLYYISEKDYKSLDKTYSNLEDLIDKENYTSKKNQKVSVNGDEIKTTAYSLTLTGEAGYKFLTGLVDKMQNDDTLKGLIVSKYDILKNYTNSITESMDDTTTKIPDLSESDVDNAFSSILESLEDIEDDLKDLEKCIKLTIYSKSDDPVKFEIAILDEENDDEGTIIFTEELSKDKNVYTIDLDKISKLTESSSSSSGLTSSISKLIITDKYEASDDSRKGTVTVSAKSSGSATQDFFTINYDTINSDSEMKLDVTVSLSKSLTSYLSLSGISGLGSGDTAINLLYHVTGLDKDTQNLEFKIGGNLASYSAEIAVTGSVSNGSEVPELTSTNSVDIFTLSEEEYAKTYTDIINSAAEKLPAKLSKFGADITKEDILKLLPTQTTTPEVPVATNPTTDPTTAQPATQPAA